MMAESLVFCMNITSNLKYVPLFKLVIGNIGAPKCPVTAENTSLPYFKSVTTYSGVQYGIYSV